MTGLTSAGFRTMERGTWYKVNWPKPVTVQSRNGLEKSHPCYCVEEAIRTCLFQERSVFACTAHAGFQSTRCASTTGSSAAGGCRESHAPETGGGRADLLAVLRRTLEGTQGTSSSKHAGSPTLRRSELLCLLHGADQHIPVS